MVYSNDKDRLCQSSWFCAMTTALFASNACTTRPKIILQPIAGTGCRPCMLGNYSVNDH